jgi:integrase
MKGGIYETRYGFQVRFGKLTKRFKRSELVLAERFLTGLRFKADEGTFDERDYRRDVPLGFANQVQKFLQAKRHLKAIKKYEQRLRFAVDAWANRSIKEITYGDIEDLLNSLQDAGKSSYYRKHIRDSIRQFFLWLIERREITHAQMPSFPTVRASIGYRKIIDKDTQDRILAEVAAITSFNPKIYIGIRFLSTYVNLRPSEMLGIKERHIDLEMARIYIETTKTGEPKYVYLLPEDVEMLAAQPRGFGELYFFRHAKGNGAAKPGDRFGKDFLYKWWMVACRNLKIEGVSLYPGTRHSSVVHLRKTHSPEAVKRATMHKTNKAFDRYLQVTGDELREIYADTRKTTRVVKWQVKKKINDFK